MTMTTVKVSNVSLGATDRDLKEFFSFSGDILYLETQSETERTKLAYVTFKDLQGAETAVLLSGATIVDSSVIVSMAPDYQLSPEALASLEPKDSNKSPKAGDSVLRKAEDVVSSMLAKGFILGKDAIAKAKSVDEKHQLTSTASAKVASFDKKIGFTDKINTGTVVVGEKVREVDQKYQVSEKTKSAIAAAEQTVSNAGSAIMKNRYVLTGATWVTGAFNKVAKAAEEVGQKAKEKVGMAEEEDKRKVVDEFARVHLSESPKAASSTQELKVSSRSNEKTCKRKFSDSTMADEAKAKGNAAFSSGDFNSAVNHFTDAINLTPTNHVLFSNRSAAHASLNHYDEALSDAKKTVELKPDWGKGYSRLGAAHLGLNQFDEAVEAYSKGLEIDPSNEGLKSGLADAKASASRSRASAPNPFGDAFQGPEMWSKLTADPSTRGLLKQPDFVNMMKEIQRNPSNLNLYLQDQRVMQALGVLLNIQIRTQQAGDDMEIGEEEMAVPSRKEPEVEKKRKPEPEPEPEPEFGEEKQKKLKAQKEKELGNAAYKKKDFETAIQHYSTAMEIDDEDISYITNRAAVHLEMGKYDECIKDCDKAVERGRELRSDYKMVAKALTRKGTALGKMAKVSKDYEPVIQTYQKALTEHRNPETLKRLNEAERAKKELEQQEYYDPNIGDEEREKGNDFFKEQKYPDAVRHYTEAIKRNPKDPRAYSNRAACYTKLGAMPEGLKDAEKCIELDPTFLKGYSRKGAVQFFMKEYDNAMETYQKGLEHDPNNQELLDGVKRCVQQINKANRGDLTPEELKERQAKGMQDPEIQNILTDPVMRQVLSDLQENPAAAQKHMQNPMIMNKIQKLISSGIVQMK